MYVYTNDMYALLALFQFQKEQRPPNVHMTSSFYDIEHLHVLDVCSNMMRIFSNLFMFTHWAFNKNVVYSLVKNTTKYDTEGSWPSYAAA